MGCTLKPHAAHASRPDAEGGPEHGGSQAPSRNQLLQQRIAKQLGISPDDFTTLRRPTSAPQRADVPVGDFDVARSRECLDLLEAYTEIRDPDQRLRCLQIVRDAAARYRREETEQ